MTACIECTTKNDKLEAMNRLLRETGKQALKAKLLLPEMQLVLHQLHSIIETQKNVLTDALTKVGKSECECLGSYKEGDSNSNELWSDACLSCKLKYTLSLPMPEDKSEEYLHKINNDDWGMLTKFPS